MKNGTFIIEAEDVEYFDDITIVSESDASGGLALKSTANSFASTPEAVKDVEMRLSVDVPDAEMGEYYLWMRAKCTSSANYSFWAKYTNYGGFKSRYIKINPDYQWVQVAKGSYGDEVFEYMIKHRDPGFKIDKFDLYRTINNTKKELI